MPRSHYTPPEPPAKSPSRTPSKDAANLPPRREGSAKPEKQEENREEGRTEWRRENARSRGFEMRVSNIALIHDKIKGLLDMVKRGQPDEPLPKAHGERPSLSGKHNRSALNLPRNDTITREKQDRAFALKTQNFKKDLSSENVPPYPSFQKEIKIQTRLASHLNDSYEYTMKSKFRTPLNARDEKSNREAMASKPEKSIPKRSYLPAEYDDRPTATPKDKPKNLFIDESVEYPKYEIKIDRKNQQYVTAKIRERQQEIQQLRREKEKRGYNLQLSIESIAPQPKLEGKFERITLQPQKRHQNPKKETKVSTPKAEASFTLPSSIPKPEASNFKPITISDQSARTQKLNTTTRLIDEQIKRIKNKIEESESHSQWMNSKLERQRGDYTISQTYAEDDDENIEM